VKLRTLYRVIGGALAAVLFLGWYLYKRGKDYAVTTFGETATAPIPWYTFLYFGVSDLMSGTKK